MGAVSDTTFQLSLFVPPTPILFQTELSTYDKIYMDTKTAYKSHSPQEYSNQIGKIDNKLALLLEKYDLHQAVHAFKEKMKHKNEPHLYDAGMRTQELGNFSDERLQKLWEKAKGGMFSESELIIPHYSIFCPTMLLLMKEFLALHKELKDAEKKTRIYHDALQEMNRAIENSIHYDESSSVDDKRASLKKAHREMSDHIEKLHQKIHEDSGTPFENERVKRLWKAAQSNGNFSEHDLSVMKDELLHFDKQLKKMAFHKKELEARRAEREKQGKMLLHAVEDVELEAKHEKMDRKLRKMEKYLEAKTRHVEL
ncbi:Alpha-2-macroglobulin RAP protein [Oesophagostomum dentatum]|uniref:Alpha-2-macroglobulin RAP protein n=1 Tax=Oesophagostomum dentatum TaxID=61180 RepID=A0A0B1TBE3_OESDE|nr:Alpha-2-macroglobulin RAP protein [Oesophagostomum dentatum]